MGNSPRSVATGRIPARVTVTVTGELDRPAIARLRTELAGWRQAGALELRLDLSGVTRCDPSLGRALVWARTQWRGHGGDLIITGAAAQVHAELAAVESFPAGSATGQPTDHRRGTTGPAVTEGVKEP
jgi:anti-anti-sigma regulatory factor